MCIRDRIIGANDEEPWVSVVFKISSVVALFVAARGAVDEFGDFWKDIKELKTIVMRMLP